MQAFFGSLSPDFAVFFELSLVIGIGAIIAIIMRLLKQPLIISHIITGLIVGPFVFNFIHSFETFSLFSEIGIAILLFTVGLNLTPKVVQQFGKVSLVAALTQVIVTFCLGFLVVKLIGWPTASAAYIGVALSFASTIIILKLISDKGDLESLYARLSIGFLLVQDIIALILLFTIPLVSAPDASWSHIVFMFAKGIVLSAVVYAIAHKVLKPLNGFLSRSQELLFLFSLSWGFIIAAIFKATGFSIETGALVAGIALAAMPSRHEITARLSTMRDFFIVIFFILLGAQLVLTGILSTVPIAIILSLIVIFVNPVILMIILGLFGYRKQTTLKTGLTVAQISEFSLIIVALGVNLGHIGQEVLSTVTLVALITIFVSTYLILHSDRLYKLLESVLSIFERTTNSEKKTARERYPIILFGCNRIGNDFVEAFSRYKKKFLAIDFNPDTVKELRGGGVSSEFGDAADIGFLESLDYSKLELAVSTIPTCETNTLIAETIRKKNRRAILMMVAHSIKDALILYDLGVDYVILPHFLGGRYALDMLLKIGTSRRKFTAIKNNHLQYLQHKLSLGHEHPVLNREQRL